MLSIWVQIGLMPTLNFAFINGEGREEREGRVLQSGRGHCHPANQFAHKAALPALQLGPGPYCTSAWEYTIANPFSFSFCVACALHVCIVTLTLYDGHEV